MNHIKQKHGSRLKVSMKQVFSYRSMIILFIIAIFFPAIGTAATYYISPIGSDSIIANGTTKNTAWKTFAHAFTKLKENDTLIVLNGTYNEQIRPTVSGSEGKPITIKAETVGGAIIQMVDDGSAIKIYSNTTKTISHITIEGLIARGKGEYPAIDVNSYDAVTEEQMTNNIIIRMTGAFGSANLSNTVVFSLGNNLRDSLFEDIWAYGFGRKALQAFGCLRIKIRRAVLRYDYWDGSGYKPNDPRVNFSGYNTVDSFFENIIALDAAPTPPGRSADRAGIVASGNETPAIITGSSNNKYLGVISINNIGNGFVVNGGTGDPTTGIYFKDIISWSNSQYGFNLQGNDNGLNIINGTFGKNGLTGLRLNPYPSYPIKNVLIQGCYSHYNVGSAYYYLDNEVANFIDNTGVGNASRNYETDYAPTLNFLVEPEFVVNYERGATIINKYVDGLLTEDSLWPWPHENLIKKWMCNEEDLKMVNRVVGNGVGWEPEWCKSGKTLTEYIWGYLGNPVPEKYYSLPGKPSW